MRQWPQLGFAVLLGFSSLNAAADSEKSKAPDIQPRRRVITVCSLGPLALADNPPLDQAVDIMINHWLNQFRQVLPDRPDLIVVPEACGRFPCMPKEKWYEYYKLRGDRVLDFFRQTARDDNCYMVYPAARVMPDGTLRNSSQLIDRNGEIIGIYDKNYTTVINPVGDAIAHSTDYYKWVTVPINLNCSSCSIYCKSDCGELLEPLEL